ncbi:MAG TPA: hypothetical protein VFP72_15345 [Kineosporiaceae bacterium]|nr:hypothetical protein [Kineosporiaceae bacterium]
MIPLARPPISLPTQRTLSRRQQRVNGATSPADEAKRSWGTFSGTARREVLDTLKRMCSGIERCMYCEDSLATTIDHYRPKATYPDHCFAWSNYLLACSYCNSNMKRDAFPVDGDQPLLIDPTTMDPLEHLALSPTTGLYVPLDRIGQATIDVFGLNRDVCTKGRRNAWTALCALVVRYAEAVEAGDDAYCDHILAAVSEYPFQGVRRWMARTASSASRQAILGSEVSSAIANYPQLLA